MFYVIGSGPSGVATAKGLLARGYPVTLLDGGKVLEGKGYEWKKNLREEPPEKWDPSLLKEVLETYGEDPFLYPKKRVFGSLFPYEEDRLVNGLEVPVSLASGGLSEVWGGSVLPYREKDFISWPITLSDLEPHYKAVSSWFCLHCGEDSLKEEFPIYGEKVTHLEPGKLIRDFFERLGRAKDIFRKRGFLFGHSRLALSEDTFCRYCGLCLYGCPYDVIFSTSQILRKLSTNPLFRYLPGWKVDKVSQEKEEVQIVAFSRSGEKRIFYGERVFLGCGVLSTTALLMRSFPFLRKRKYFLSTSWNFYIPFFYIPGLIGRNREEKYHSMAKIFLEWEGFSPFRAPVHIQVYDYSPLYFLSFRKFLGKGSSFLSFLFRRFFTSLFVFQGFLPSSLSPRFSIQWEEDHFVSQKEENPYTRKVVREFYFHLLSLSPYLRGFPVGYFFVQPPGRGAHFGGTFPMRKNPEEWETDIWGRLPFSSRIHVVDSSIFPTLPATTITFTLMANAHRIAEGDW